ncbi:MAG TPA: hypothetical protein VF416_11970, partial [Marmoricola sp.]
MRVYVPATIAVLAELVARGELPASTDRFVAADDSEDAEYDALSEAAAASAVLLGGPGRRVVIVAELDDADGVVPVSLVAAVHADAEPVDAA